MIAISDLSTSYIQKVTTAETASVVGGFFNVDSYNTEISSVSIGQLNLASFATYNAVGSVNTFQ